MKPVRRGLASLAGFVFASFAAFVSASLWAAPSWAATGDPSHAGSYCPFPAEGEKPVCFAEVEHQFGDFLQAVDAGKIDSAELVEVEDQLKTGPTEAERTLALSSLAYGYFMLAERAAAAEHPDPALVARLQRWNELLGAVYADAKGEPAFRTAIRDAARDLHARAPAVPAPCDELADGEPCRNGGAVLDTLRGIDDPEAESGLRGALGRLLARMLQDPPQAEAPPRE